MKSCSKCKVVSNNFSPDSRHGDGLSSQCRLCGSASARRLQAERRLNPIPRSTSPKFCPHCRKTKPPEDFNTSRLEAGGLTGLCRNCERIKGFKRNGVVLVDGDYEKLLTGQRGVCAVCERPAKTRALHLDHDHETKEIRGLLCSSCNRAIGLLQDSHTVLRRAADYLEVNQSERIV